MYICEFQIFINRKKNIISEENRYYLSKEGKCIQKQYGKYVIAQSTNNEAIYLNGGDTLDENVADNIGLNLSYELYNKRKNDEKIKEKKIPELRHFNDDQLFFLGFANVCKLFKQKKNSLDYLFIYLFSDILWKRD